MLRTTTTPSYAVTAPQTPATRFGKTADAAPVTAPAVASTPDKAPAKKPDIKGASGLWVTTEMGHSSLPAVLKSGGLAEVSGGIPWQLHKMGVDIRPIFPYYKAMQDQGFKKADLAPITLPPINGDEPEECQLYYKVIDGVTCYAIGSPSFSQHNDLYKALASDKNPIVQKNEEPSHAQQHSGGVAMQHSGGVAEQHSGGVALQHSGGTATASKPGKIINKGVFRFNQAVAAFAPLLNGTKGADNSTWQFNGEADVNFFNDWMSGVTMGELAANNPKHHYRDKTQSVFFVHNTYNPQSMTLETAKKLGITIPDDVKAEHTRYIEEADDENDEDNEALTTGRTKPIPLKALKPDPWATSWLKGLFGQQAAEANNPPDSKEAKANRKLIKKLDEKGWGVSPLAWGLRYADHIIINDRFKHTNINTAFPNDPAFRRFLREKDASGNVFDMHHALKPANNPYNSPFLAHDGYTQMGTPEQNAKEKDGVNDKKAVGANAIVPGLRNTLSRMLPGGLTPSKQAKLEQLKNFKATNKLALQKELGLKQDPNAVIYSFLARASDPRQKGVFRIINTMEKFLTENPHAQYVLGGGFNEDNPIPEIAAIANSVKANPLLKDRVYFGPFLGPKTSQRILASSTYIMNPSTYEPYGLSHIEGMVYGTVPLITGRDGLYATSYDPHVLPQYNPSSSDHHRAAYGQTAYLMDDKTDNIDYIKAVDNHGADPTHPAVRQSNEAFLKVMQRSYKDAAKGKHWAVALNGMDYAKKEHSEDAISQRYVPIIQHALMQKQAKQKTLAATG
jgi:glycogen synthase